MFGREITKTRLKSRRSSIQTAKELPVLSQKTRLQRWQDDLQTEELMQPTQQLPLGVHLPLPL